MDKPKSSQEEKEQKTHQPQWGALLKLLTDHLLEATRVPKYNDQEMSVEERNAYYRAIFNKVRQEAALRDDIPNSIMDKPVQTLTLTFYGRWNGPVCLSCLNFDSSDDIIHVKINAKENEPDGVTKDDLICRLCEVLYGGLHVRRETMQEIGIVPSNFDWLCTDTRSINPEDNILYIGYKSAAEASSIEGERDGLKEKSDALRGSYEVTWESEALKPGASAIQGYNNDYAQKLLASKGWHREDWDLCLAV
ncbi:hypothetical protein F4804DRAFT_343409 [Jackrogersella minutella]|nr:hypothetical protein F4804DRAFT_343409 [Jackrogersella minutella]